MKDIFDSEVVQKTPPSLRSKSIRVLGPKTTVAARIDSNGGDSTFYHLRFDNLISNCSFFAESGDTGRGLKEGIAKKVEKWLEPPPTKQPKPLAAPDDRPKKRRAGRRVRKMKEKYATTEMRKQANRMAFGVAEEETASGKGLDIQFLYLPFSIFFDVK